jgi:hypothetical protein
MFKRLFTYISGDSRSIVSSDLDRIEVEYRLSVATIEARERQSRPPTHELKRRKRANTAGIS